MQDRERTDLKTKSTQGRKSTYKAKETNTKDVKLPSHFIEAAEDELDMKTGIQNEGDLKDLKDLLSTSWAITFNTNVLRISLNMQEEKIASVIIAKFKAKIDEEMVLRACKTA